MFSLTKSLAFAAVLLGTSSLSSAAGQFVQQKGVKEFTGTMIVRPASTELLLRRGVAPSAIATIQARAKQRLNSVLVRYENEIGYAVVRVPKGMNENTYSDQLNSTGEYEYATPNWRLYPVGVKTTPNDPRFSQQWHHKTIHSEEAWTIWKGTNNVTVAIVDTGVFTSHEDLSRGVVKGYNSILRQSEASGASIQDEHGHGTHCAGDAAAQGNNSVGLVGEGWNFKIMPIKAAGPSGGASLDDLMDGAKWAVTHGAKVVSISFSGVDAPVIGTTGTFVKSKGGLMLYAAGNDNRDLSGFSYPDTVVVGASDEGDGKAGFSAYGRGVSVFAPGTNIWSTTMDGSYQPFSGTSMATPVTNGACALVWSINPSLTPNQVQSILYNNCDQIGNPSIFGHGRINLYKMAQAAAKTLTVPSNFGPNAISLLQGTYVSGTISDVANGTGTGYKVDSQFLNLVGQSMLAKLTFKINYNLNQLRELTPLVKFSNSIGTGGTAMIYLFNYSTNSYQQIKSEPVLSDGSTTTVSMSLSAGYSSYVGSDGTVQLAARILSPIGRRGEPGGQFRGSIRYAQLQTKKAQ